MKYLNRATTTSTWLWATMVFMALMVFADVVWADTFQSLESIRLATRTFLDHKVNVETDRKRFRIDVDRLDLHLRLPTCPVALEGFLPLGGRLHGRTTVGVRCPVGPGWTIYVPARVKAFKKMQVGAATNDCTAFSVHNYS
ncbi:MAG: hypothetical protein V3S33_02940 [Gammaproteobacteria bacterium]